MLLTGGVIMLESPERERECVWMGGWWWLDGDKMKLETPLKKRLCFVLLWSVVYEV